MKALREIGVRRAARFGFFTLAMVPYRALLFPQLRALYLRLLGARVGKRTILHDVRFFNLYRKGLPGLSIGHECFLGEGACWTWPRPSCSRIRSRSPNVCWC